MAYLTGPTVYPIAGPPGAGKTTAVLTLIRLNAQFVRFGVRDYGLQLAATGDPLGLAMQDILQRNELLPNKLVRQEFKHFLSMEAGQAHVVLVEGYPRDLNQCVDLANVVNERGGRIPACIFIEAPDHIVVRRVAGRRICAVCGIPATHAQANGCTNCGGPLKKRADDAADRIRRRLVEYRGLEAEVRNYFSRNSLLHTIDSMCGPHEVLRALEALIQLPLSRFDRSWT